MKIWMSSSAFIRPMSNMHIVSWYVVCTYVHMKEKKYIRLDILSLFNVYVVKCYSSGTHSWKAPRVTTRK